MLHSIGLSLSETQYHDLLEMVSRITNAQAAFTAELSRFVERFRAGTETEMRTYIKWYKQTLNADWLPELKDAEIKEKKVHFKLLRAGRALMLIRMLNRIECAALRRRDSLRGFGALASTRHG